MNWNKLKENRCPGCGRDLTYNYNPHIRLFECMCGFKIGANKFKEIVNKQIDKTLKERYE